MRRRIVVVFVVCFTFEDLGEVAHKNWVDCRCESFLPRVCFAVETQEPPMLTEPLIMEACTVRHLDC